MKELEDKLGYSFKDESIIKMALTHSSYANENKRRGIVCNERLEFLGDSILGMIVAEYLYKNEPDMPEGSMTRLRSELVCEGSLVKVASEIGLGQYLLLGHGEENGGGRKRPSISADAVEAVIAAMYLDGGRGPAESFIKKYILSRYEKGMTKSTDSKTALQELIQKKSGQELSYKMTGESGPDHMKEFTAQVYLNGVPMGEGTGRNKKEAEQAAAKAALEAMGK